MENICEAEGEAAERAMDLEPTTSTVEEVDLEGLHLDTNINGSKKRKSEEKSLDGQDINSWSDSNEEEIHKKRKRDDLKLIQETMSLKQATDELDLMCKIWVMELRRLPLDQQLFARKAVCDVLFEARLGQLNKDSVRINRSDVVQNYLTCVHEEHGKICACPNAWEPQQRYPPPLQTYSAHPNCYHKGTWKGNLSTPHRPPFLSTYSNRFAAPNNVHYPTGPRIGRPIVITTAMNNITTTTIVVVTPRMITTAPTSSNQVVTTTRQINSNEILNPPRNNSVNISAYRIDASTNTPTQTTRSNTSSIVTAPNLGTQNTPISPVTRPNASSILSIPSNTNNPTVATDPEPIIRIQQSTKPTVNSSTTPTINTLCDVRMDTVTTDN